MKQLGNRSMMRIPRWLRLEDAWSTSNAKRDEEDDPKPSLPDPPIPPDGGPPPPPPPPSPKTTKSKIELSTTTSTTSITSSTKTIYSTSSSTSSLSSLSSSLSTTSSCQTTTSTSTSSSSLSTSLSTSTQQSTNSALLNTSPTPSATQITSRTTAIPSSSLTAEAVPTTPSSSFISTTPIFSTTPPSISGFSFNSPTSSTPTFNLPIPTTIPVFTSSTTSAILQSSTLPPKQPNPLNSTDGNRNTPAAVTSTSILLVGPAPSPVVQSSSLVATPTDVPADLQAQSQPSAGVFVLVGVAIGASTAILLALLLLLCRKLDGRGDRQRKSSQKRVSWSSQPSVATKHGGIPSVIFAAQMQTRMENQSAVMRNPNNGTNLSGFRGQNQNQSPIERVPGSGWEFIGNFAATKTGTMGMRVQELDGERSISQSQLQRQMSTQTGTGTTVSQEPMTVYKDQLPAFAARLEELGIAGISTVNNNNNNNGPYAPQLQLNFSPVSDNRERQGSLGWFGSSLDRNASQVSTIYTVSPVDQRQQSPWQLQLPGIEETSQMRSRVEPRFDGTVREQVFELSGNAMDEKLVSAAQEKSEAWKISGAEKDPRRPPPGVNDENVPRWKDPLAWAREQRMKNAD